MSKYAVDFDGVIVKRNGIPTLKEDTNDLDPIDGAREAIEWLIFQGHELYILTAHEPLREVEEWLRKRDFPHLFCSHIKQSGTKAIIDDRAIRFTNWQDIRKLLE